MFVFFRNHTLAAAALAIALCGVASTATAGTVYYHSHEADEQEQDTPEQRKQAANEVSWHDAHNDNNSAWVHFKILGFNDFHGQLSSGKKVGGRPVGSAPVLAAYLEAAAEQSEDGAIMVHAGDQVGASPPVSALLQDEPSITFLNMLANDQCRYRQRLRPDCNLVGTLGNHEFDEGVAEMTRLIDGGIHAQGPFLDAHYRGARFPYVSANVVDAKTGRPLLPPYVIKRVRGLPVAFIGAVLKETPSIVTPTGVAGVRFLDEADAINSYIPELKARGVRAIVVTIHQGTYGSSYTGPTDSTPQVLAGAIGDIVARLDDEVDIVISGHAHGFTNALVTNRNGKQILVTQAFSAGTAFADIDVAIDPVSRDIVAKSASIVTTWADAGAGLTPDAKVAELVTQAEARVAPLVNRVVGVATMDILKSENNAGESALGDMIADAQRIAMGSDFAFMNPGGIRADLNAGEVTWGALFAVQPFNNDLVRMDLSGAQIRALLNQQWVGQPFPRILKISGLTYVWDFARPAGDRIVELRTASGQPVEDNALYSVTVNSFLAAGGDNFSVLTQGQHAVVGPVDLDALVKYVGALPQPFSYAIDGRMQRLN
jgi:5'-nucleotidase